MSEIELSEADLKQKCKDIKHKILKVEDLNKVAAINIKRTKTSINRLRLEYAILLERLESRTVVNDTSDVSDNNFEIRDKKAPRKKKASSSNTIRDPDLPKKPLNPYLMFCEQEKEKYRKQAESEGGKISDFSKILGEAWKNLGEEGRQRYAEIYSVEKEKYYAELEAYESNPKKSKNNDGKPISTKVSNDDDDEDLTHKEPHNSEETTKNDDSATTKSENSTAEVKEEDEDEEEEEDVTIAGGANPDDSIVEDSKSTADDLTSSNIKSEE